MGITSPTNADKVRNSDRKLTNPLASHARIHMYVLYLAHAWLWAARRRSVLAAKVNKDLRWLISHTHIFMRMWTAQYKEIPTYMSMRVFVHWPTKLMMILMKAVKRKFALSYLCKYCCLSVQILYMHMCIYLLT